jgi:hypothetical protein
MTRINQCREDQKMEESGRMEERVAALESVVNFLVSQIGENQKRPIKSELKRLKRSPEVAATYDDWPATPYLFQRLG